MGYNLTIVSRNVKLRNKMVKFMSDKDLGNATWSPEERGTKDIVIGFSSSLYGEERLFTFSIARWIALKVGIFRSNFNKGFGYSFDPPVPFIFYENEAWPILVCDSEKQAKQLWQEDLLWCVMDSLGVYLIKSNETVLSAVKNSSLYNNSKQAKTYDSEIIMILKKIRAKIRKIDKAWTKEKNNG